MYAWILRYANYPIYGFLVWIGWCLDFDKLPQNKIYADAITETRVAAPQLVLYSSVLFLGIELLNFFLSPKHPAELKLEKAVKAALDEFRKSVFPGIVNSSGPDHHNRVTLFKHHKNWKLPSPWRSFFWPWGIGCSPWSGWLVAIYRSGHATQNLRTAFYCPDDGESGEGVASKAYFNGACRIAKLPTFDRRESSCLLKTWLLRLMIFFKVRSEKVEKFQLFWSNVCVYAEETSTSRYSVWCRIRKMRACPNNILGVRVEDTKNDVWGVLIMDSSNDIVCIDSNTQKFRSEFTRLNNKLRTLGVID